jgi:hypothetical protein
MITIQKSEKVLNLDKKPLTFEDGELTITRALSLIVISGSKSPDPLKAYQLAKKIEDAELIVELSDEDVDFIKNATVGFQGFTTLVIGQILDRLQQDDHTDSKTN